MKLLNTVYANIHPAYQLMRWHRPVGFWLLLWPSLWALWIAVCGMPPWKIVLIFIVGAALMRAAGCVINDLTDQKWDGSVERTATRPLVQGRVTRPIAYVILGALLCCALILVSYLHRSVLYASCGALALAAVYPWMKRFFIVPQLILGCAFSCGIPMAFLELTGTVSFTTWLLCLANICWVLAYDTQYAVCDHTEDRQLGLHSSVLFFGHWTLFWIVFFQCTTLIFLYWLGCRVHLHRAYFICLICAACIFLYQYRCMRLCQYTKNYSGFLNIFECNAWFGAVVFLAIFLGLECQ